MKLNTDNPELMPVTDAVYGRRKQHTDSKPAKPRREDGSLQMFRRLPKETWDAMKEALREAR